MELLPLLLTRPGNIVHVPIIPLLRDGHGPISKVQFGEPVARGLDEAGPVPQRGEEIEDEG